jgi:transposase-like protein
MVIHRRRSRLSVSIQRALIVQFVSGVPARTAAEVVGVNRRTSTLFYHKLRELIAAKLAAEAPFSAGEVEVDESYFGGVRKGKRGQGAAVDGIGRRCLRQCDVRELFRHPRMRVAGSPPVRLPGRGAHGLLQLYRRLVQSRATALRTRLSLAYGIRSSYGEHHRTTITNKPSDTPPNRGSFTRPARIFPLRQGTLQTA